MINKLHFSIILICLHVGLSHAQTEPKTQALENGGREISHALDMYFVDCHQYPPSLQQLLVKPEGCKNWGPDPYLRSLPTDPWKRPWNYQRLDNNNFRLVSLGADGREGGVGDDLDFTLNAKAPELSPAVARMSTAEESKCRSRREFKSFCEICQPYKDKSSTRCAADVPYHGSSPEFMRLVHSELKMLKACGFDIPSDSTICGLGDHMPAVCRGEEKMPDVTKMIHPHTNNCEKMKPK